MRTHFEVLVSRWGGINGFMFLTILAMGVILANTRQDAVGWMQTALFVFAALVPASLVAFAIGAAVGVLFAGIDLILLGIAARLIRGVRSAA